MKILIQKFGGTSLSTPSARHHAIKHIASAKNQGYRVVVVVSALGRPPDPYATDSLLTLLRKESSRREKDLLMSCGEILSVAIMADLLEGAGVPAEPLILNQIGIITDEEYGNADILEINPAPVLAALDQGKIVIIPGFQGIAGGNHVTTLGRGGSDTTATAMGAALKAELIEIYTDVDGVMSADPKIVPEACTISEITFKEVGEMAYLGSKVLHPKSVSFAMEAGIPIRIRSTFSDNPGTVVTQNPVTFHHVVTGIAHIPEVAYVQLHLLESAQHDQLRVKIFKSFAEAGISLDLITVNAAGISFIIQERQAAAAKKLLESMEWLQSHFIIESGFAKVSVIGAGMRGRPGVMARITETLLEAGIDLYHSTDSHITIACLVKQADMEKAVQVLHKAFISEK